MLISLALDIFELEKLQFGNKKHIEAAKTLEKSAFPYQLDDLNDDLKRKWNKIDGSAVE